MFKDNFGGHDGLNRSLEVVRANPLAFALIGIGTAWLIASNTNVVARIAQNERVEAVRRRAANLVAGVASDIGARAGEVASEVAAAVASGEGSHPAADRPLGHTGNPMVDAAGPSGSDGWVHHVAGMAEDALRSARDSGGAMLNRAGSYAGDGASRIADQLSGAFERHPLAIGTVTIIAGAALALLLPPTRTEDAVLGGTGEELRHTAQGAGQQTVARVREVGARAAARAALSGEVGKGELSQN